MDIDEASEAGSRHAFTTDMDRWFHHLKAFGRANRKQPTEAEEQLWKALRGGQLQGFRFRRQHAINRFIVDFVCLRAWLIIEVDGEVHHEAGQAEYDTGRTHELEALGFHVLRFTNEQVLHYPRRVLATIRPHLSPDQNTSTKEESSGSPSPQGEGAGG
ncbi:Very-short-patch-repair endonuclease [Hymenobacter daecheongensis DSM 21074]|uniref:Very-short-patch-repair endonuclease n=1 Tax=Hymenobacter daecheongensis DSM 21074 TaxID=1121955 RepID=A0A1M6L8B7_9BACT|nr:endonuclease domain-containing protein [Hymenobacter daecheongensis]SHJ67435.1 Very-short-patch-repair endonuclease [Hymenobacter daecheongensis DSM 21074]